MTPGDYSQKLQELSSELRSEYQKYFLASVTGLTGIIQDRVQNKFTNYLGNNFSTYSITQFEAKKFYKDATRVRKGLRELKVMQRKHEKLSWFELRVLTGKTNNRNQKNFDFSGDMWLRFGAKQRGEKVVVGFSTASATKKAKENSEYERYSIIKPSKGEIQGLIMHLEQFVINKFKQKGLA